MSLRTKIAIARAKHKYNAVCISLRYAVHVLSIASIGAVIGGSSVFIYAHYTILFERNVQTYSIHPIERAEASFDAVNEVAEVKEVVETHTATVTAYNSMPSQTDSSPCIGADNTNLCEYKGCAVAMNGVKMGTKINLEGFGECTVKDRKNSRYDSNWIDVYFGGAENHQKALQFGKKTLNYSFIK